VNAGIGELLGLGDEQLALGFEESLGSELPGAGRGLRGGHIAVVLASDSELPPNELVVLDRRLRRRGADRLTTLEGFTYLLFCVEKRSSRDDREALPEIRERLDSAMKALEFGADERAKDLRRAAIIAAHASDSLTTADRRRVAQAIDDRLEGVSTGLGAVPVEPQEFATLVEATMPVDRALALGAPTLDELLG
jgi:hypothetical protein